MIFYYCVIVFYCIFKCETNKKPARFSKRYEKKNYVKEDENRKQRSENTYICQRTILKFMHRAWFECFVFSKNLVNCGLKSHICLFLPETLAKTDKFNFWIYCCSVNKKLFTVSTIKPGAPHTPADLRIWVRVLCSDPDFEKA